MRNEQPAIVTICGSTRFRDEMAIANRELTLAGHIVLAPGVFGHAGDPMTDEQKVALDELHLRKIDLAELVYVVNPSGYIGDSTRREIAYAQANGKPVRLLVTGEHMSPDHNLFQCNHPDCRRDASAAQDDGDTAPTFADALAAMTRAMAMNVRDWGSDRMDAFLWGVLLGWDCDEAHEHNEFGCSVGAMDNIAERHGWSTEQVERVRAFHQAVLAASAPNMSGDQP